MGTLWKHSVVYVLKCEYMVLHYQFHSVSYIPPLWIACETFPNCGTSTQFITSDGCVGFHHMHTPHLVTHPPVKDTRPAPVLTIMTCTYLLWAYKRLSEVPHPTVSASDQVKAQTLSTRSARLLCVTATLPTNRDWGLSLSHLLTSSWYDPNILIFDSLRRYLLFLICVKATLHIVITIFCHI